jgi:hypothetical protein
MMTLGTRLIRIVFILGLLTFLSTSIPLAPRQAAARPVTTGGPDGEPYGTGDPTGDDIPSPTPKPSPKPAAPAPRATVSGTHTLRQGISGSTYRWNIYFAILVRLGIR